MKDKVTFMFTCFRWLNGLLSLGAKQPLQAEDLYGLLKQEQTDTLTETLERYYSMHNFYIIL